MLERLKRLLDHMEWANRRALDAVREAESPRALRRLAHLLGAESVWLRRLETGDGSGLEIWPELTVEECQERSARNLSGYRALLDGLTEGELAEPVTYRNSKGVEFRTPRDEILLHVFMHGSYHRGQIAMRVRDGGGEPVNTDFITFVRERPRHGR